jgi:predicted permease
LKIAQVNSQQSGFTDREAQERYTMNKLRAFWNRLCGTLLQRHRDGDLDQELDTHLTLDTERGVREGLPYTEARRQALIRLGGAEQVRTAYRERRGLPWLDSLLRDLRYSARSLGRHKAVTAIAIVSIGLGIGANATIFSIVSRFMLRPAPVGNPSSLLALHIATEGEDCCNSFSWPLVNDLRQQATVFSGVAAYYVLIPASLSGDTEPERVWGQGVSTNFFRVAEVPMVLGSGFADRDDHTPLVILSERLWRRRFNSDAGIVGKNITLSGHTFTVSGIAPAALRSIDQILDCEFWVPLGMMSQLVPSLPPQDSREYHALVVVGRMRPGVSRAQVAAQLETLAQRFAIAYPKTDKGNHFIFEQAGSLPPGERSMALLFLSALSVVVLLVLAIAGANVANLLFAQAVNRQREMAVRIALGATPSRLRGLMLAESLLLGLGGGAVGTLLSLWSTQALSTFHIPAPVPLDLRVALDARTLIYTFALSAVCGVLLGLAPAWAASRPRIANALKGDVDVARGRRVTLRSLLVVAQVAMSLVLLSVTGLFLRSMQNAARIDIGFQPRGLLLLSVDPRLNGYTPPRTSAFLTELRQRVAALPGVDAAVATDVALLSGGNRSDGFTVSGHSAKGDPFSYADLYMTTPGYFDAMGTARLAGRDFSDSIAKGPRVAVVNKAFADSLFHGANPIGQHVDGGHWTYEIIGVVANAKSRTVGEDTRPILYRSLDQTVADDPSLMGYTLVVHTPGNPSALAEAVRRQVYAIDPAMAIFNEETWVTRFWPANTVRSASPTSPARTTSPAP